MSDALTDIRRDEERMGLLQRIRQLEREFLAAPDREKAGDLERLWAAYAQMRRGYWGGPNKALAWERVAWYHAWRPEEGTEWLARFYGEGATVETGAGFVADSRVFEDLFKRAVLEQGQGPFSHSVFRVKIRMEVERLTCRNCPRFSKTCGTAVCDSQVDEELAERKKLAKEGRVLVERSG